MTECHRTYGVLNHCPNLAKARVEHPYLNIPAASLSLCTSLHLQGYHCQSFPAFHSLLRVRQNRVTWCRFNFSVPMFVGSSNASTHMSSFNLRAEGITRGKRDRAGMGWINFPYLVPKSTLWRSLCLDVRQRQTIVRQPGELQKEGADGWPSSRIIMAYSLFHNCWICWTL